MNLCVLSCCYEKPEQSAILRESCELFGLDLGMCAAKELNSVWPADGDMRIGKLKAAHEMLLGFRDYYTHVLWADGFDTFVAHEEFMIMRRYYEMGYPPLILSGEKNCWPEPHLKNLYPESASPYRFVNAGTWMGQLGYLCDAIKMLLDRSKGQLNDQAIWSNAFVNGWLPGAVIDAGRRIFQTMWGATEEELAAVDPCVIHYNGGIWRNPEDTRLVDHWARVKAERCGL